jgi:hypothetical protein
MLYILGQQFEEPQAAVHHVVAELFECKSSEERVVYKKLNSTETLIQRTTMEAPQQICITLGSTFTSRQSATA